jgi:Putative peptidoglycan binding domain
MISMPDSVNVADLPPGYPAYLGYADGRYANAAELRKRFPGAQLVRLTVTGATLDADGIDVEPGNVNAADARVWVQRKLAAAPGFRPVIYASVRGAANYGMGDILARLNGNRISTKRVRLLSAHYGEGPHICGPHSCGLIDIDMDGTQYTNDWATPAMRAAGTAIDMSMLSDDYFAGPGPAQTETERLVRELGIIRQGMTGEPVKTVQALCNARTPVPELSIDGVFGPRTLATVKAIQADARISADGIVGPDTWPVLLGVA